ncbi:hypothetical protein [Streptomyces sp. NPDC048590]|uniref:hypothetical protein n=1 Tax=Streptomyces sp. NPDC048590 TaxID=3365574 RepID=UPI0037208A37
MQSDPVIENIPAPRGRRRAHAAPSRSAGHPQGGPVFVDSSGRRAKLLRRAGLLLGTLCLGYAGVLGLAFMGGISLTPSQLMPFDGDAEAGPGAGYRPGQGTTPPSGAPAPPGSGGALPSGEASAPATGGTD